MPARRPRARSCIYRPGLARVDAFSWSQDLAARIRWLGPRPLCMHDAQQRVAVQYILARSCPCRCVRLEPGYKSLIIPPLRDMAGIYVYIIKNEVRYSDDTVPKTVDTRKHCKVGLRACNNLPQPPPYIFVFGGCGRLLHALNPTLQCFLVSTVFGTVSSLHLTSFLMIFTLVFLPIMSVSVSFSIIYVCR